MKQPTIDCPNCHGRGKVDLDGPLAETLQIVRSLKVATAFDVLARIDEEIKITAVNNRLESLRALGLLIRTKHGRRWSYRYTKLKTQNT